MTRRGRAAESPSYIDTPRGIFTASGIWFSTTEEKLKEYAGALPDVVSVESLIAEAERWLHSAKSVGVWSLGIMLLLMDPAAALLFSILVFMTWRVFSPAVVNRFFGRVLQVLNLVIVQGILFVVVLSGLGMAGWTGSVIIGVLGFVLYRWDLLDRILQPLVTRAWRRLYRLPVPDQVLRLVVIRATIRHGVSIPDVDRMKAEVIELLSRNEKS